MSVALNTSQAKSGDAPMETDAEKKKRARNRAFYRVTVLVRDRLSEFVYFWIGFSIAF